MKKSLLIFFSLGIVQAVLAQSNQVDSRFPAPCRAKEVKAYWVDGADKMCVETPSFAVVIYGFSQNGTIVETMISGCYKTFAAAKEILVLSRDAGLCK